MFSDANIRACLLLFPFSGCSTCLRAGRDYRYHPGGGQQYYRYTYSNGFAWKASLIPTLTSSLSKKNVGPRYGHHIQVTNDPRFGHVFLCPSCRFSFRYAGLCSAPAPDTASGSAQLARLL